MKWIILGLCIVLVGALAIVAFKLSRKERGKTDLAVSALSAIGAIWMGYISLFAVNWPQVAIVYFLDVSPETAATTLEVSPWTTISAAILAAVLSAVIYRLTTVSLRRTDRPLNPSAYELEELGQELGVINLAAARLRYFAAGQPDRNLHTRGVNPYLLPNPKSSVDWCEVLADLFLHIEPNLSRESFRYVGERSLFTMIERDVFKPTRNHRWIFYPTKEVASDLELLDKFEEKLAAAKIPDNLKARYCICLSGNEVIDRRLSTQEHDEVWLISEAALIQKSLDFSQYVSSLVTRFENLPVPGTDFSLLDCFVPPRVREVSPRDSLGSQLRTVPEQDLISLLTDWTERPHIDHLSIIGEFGQGKSTAVLAFCARWARRWHEGDRTMRIPLLIELRGKSPKRQAPDVFLGEWGGRFGLSGSALLSLVKAGRATLVFEGFDEIQDAGLRLERHEQFAALWSFSYPDTKIIFTGRPNFFLDTRELEQLLRSSSAARTAGLDSSRILSLCFLDADAIRQALGKFDQRIQDGILAACKADQAFMDIARRPSMLPVLGSRWDDIHADMQAHGGITSAGVINHFIDFLYRRKEADHERLGDFQLLHRDVRHYFTKHVAWQMVTAKLRNTIGQEAFSRAIERGYAALDAEFRETPDADPNIADSIRRLKERFRTRPPGDIIIAISTDVRSYGLLVPDPAGGVGNLYFSHKQYYEHILGQIFAEYAQIPARNSWLANISAWEMRQALNFEMNCILFAAGLIPNDILNNSSKPDIKLKLLGFVIRLFVWPSINLGYINIGSILFQNKRTMQKYLARRRARKAITSSCPTYLLTIISHRDSAYLSSRMFYLIFAIFIIIPFSLFSTSALSILLDSLSTADIVRKTNWTDVVFGIFAIVSPLMAAALFYSSGVGFAVFPRWCLMPYLIAAEFVRNGTLLSVEKTDGPKAVAAVALGLNTVRHFLSVEAVQEAAEKLQLGDAELDAIFVPT